MRRLSAVFSHGSYTDKKSAYKKKLSVREVSRLFFVDVPLPLFGLALGVFALGNVLAPLSFIAYGICGVVAGLFWLVAAVRVVFFPQSIMKEIIESPGAAGAFAALFLSSALLSGYLSELYPVVGMGVWVASVLFAGLYGVWFSAFHLRVQKFSRWYPSVVLPFAAMMVLSIATPAEVPHLVREILFWIGAVCFFGLLPPLALRHVKHGTPDEFRPLNSYFAGPAGLALSAYLTTYAATYHIAVVVVLCVVSQILLVAVLARLPVFMRLAFVPSFASFSFSFLSSATAFGKSISTLQAHGIDLTGWLGGVLVIEQAGAIVMTCYIAIRFSIFLIKKMRNILIPVTTAAVAFEGALERDRGGVLWGSCCEIPAARYAKGAHCRCLW